jgi:hypothetical protein
MIRIHFAPDGSLTVEAPDTVLRQRHTMNRLLALVEAARQARQSVASPTTAAELEPLPGLFEPTHEFIDGPINDDTEYFQACKGRKIAVCNLDVDGMVNGFFCDDQMPTLWIKPERLRKISG